MHRLAVWGLLLVGLLHGGAVLAEPHVQGGCQGPECSTPALGNPAPQDGAQPEQAQAAREQAQSSPTVTLPVAKPVEPVKSAEYEAPCDEDQDDRDSDLCAQWKAADNAAEAARWAFWQTILSVAGFGGLAYNLVLTRRATKVAIDATKDADKALEIAARTADAAAEANRQNWEAHIADQRPWVSVGYSPGGPIAFTPHGLLAHFGFRLKNTGKTPALNVSARVRIHTRFIVEDLRKEQLLFADEALAAKDDVASITLFPGERGNYEVLAIVREEERAAAKAFWNEQGSKRNDGVLVRVVGCVQYGTIFSKDIYQTGFVFEVFGAETNQILAAYPTTGVIPRERLSLRRWAEDGRVT